MSIDDLVGVPLDRARTMLGYPDFKPGLSIPGPDLEVISQDDATDMTAPLIVTAMCWQPEGTQRMVLETANPSQVSPEESDQLKFARSASRQDHIRQVTGCDSRYTGVPVKHPR